MSNLASRLDVLPEKWEHETDDKLFGELVSVGTWEGKFEPCTVITVLVLEEGSTERGGKPIPIGAERRFYGSPASARSQLEQQEPQVGDTIGVKYHGLGEARPGESPPHRYRILTEKAAREPGEVVEPAVTGAGPESAVPPGGAGIDEDIPFNKTSYSSSL